MESIVCAIAFLRLENPGTMQWTDAHCVICQGHKSSCGPHFSCPCQKPLMLYLIHVFNSTDVSHKMNIKTMYTSSRSLHSPSYKLLLYTLNQDEALQINIFMTSAYNCVETKVNIGYRSIVLYNQESLYSYQLDCISNWAIYDTGWTIGVLGFDSRWGLGLFSSPPSPERRWGLPSLLSDGYQGIFLWG
jgi:hypothetical protein